MTGAAEDARGELSKRVVNERQVVKSAKQAVVKVRDEDIQSEVKEAFETSDWASM